MLHLAGVRAGASLARPLLWLLGGLGVVVLAGASAQPSVPAAGAGLPVAGASITQRFGCTTLALEPFDAACATRHFHSGVDLSAAAGTPVRSVCAGTATAVRSTGGYGIHAIVDCGAGVVMLYGHLSATAVLQPEPVSVGALLGWVGSTGLSTGPHLHFEVRRDGTAVDPMSWLPDYAGGPNLRREQRW